MTKKKKIAKTVFIVQYNDCHGNGDDDSIEAVVKNRTGFKNWLAEHNRDRRADGNEPESAEEFDLIETQMVEYK